jgi:phage baseplate assembly protein W
MKNVFADFDAFFGMNPITGDVPLRTDVEAIKFAVKSLVLTNHYERPFHSEIGSNVRAMLFENMGPMTAIILREDISMLLDNYEPRISVTAIDINMVPDSNVLYITIVFIVKNTNQQLSVSVALERTR